MQVSEFFSPQTSAFNAISILSFESLKKNNNNKPHTCKWMEIWYTGVGMCQVPLKGTLRSDIPLPPHFCFCLSCQPDTACFFSLFPIHEDKWVLIWARHTMPVQVAQRGAAPSCLPLQGPSGCMPLPAAPRYLLCALPLSSAFGLTHSQRM